MQLKVKWDARKLAALRPGRLDKAIARALSKAGSTALRDMRAESTKRIRDRKRIKVSAIREAVHIRRPKRATIIDGLKWAVQFSGKPVSLVVYPHRQTKLGVSVEVNRGKRTLIRRAFLATMRSGHEGVFVREGKKRLPIRELLGSRPVDAMLHKGEAQGVLERGQRSLSAAFARLLPLELEKVGGG